MAHKWANWLHDPCRLGGPQRFKAGDKITSAPHDQRLDHYGDGAPTVASGELSLGRGGGSSPTHGDPHGAPIGLWAPWQHPYLLLLHRNYVWLLLGPALCYCSLGLTTFLVWRNPCTSTSCTSSLSQGTHTPRQYTLRQTRSKDIHQEWEGGNGTVGPCVGHQLFLGPCVMHLLNFRNAVDAVGFTTECYKHLFLVGPDSKQLKFVCVHIGQCKLQFL